MKAVIVFTAIRVLDVGEPETGQSKEEFLQLCKEGTVSDPFSFIDAGPEAIEVSCLVSEVTQ